MSMPMLMNAGSWEQPVGGDYDLNYLSTVEVWVGQPFQKAEFIVDL